MAALLGVAWSPVAATMRDLSYFVDIVEAPGWMLDDDDLQGQTRVLLHNLDRDVSLAHPAAIDDAWGARISAALKRTGTPWFSMHLGFSAECVRFVDTHMLPESPTLPRETLRERIVAAARVAKGLVDAPLLLENLDYCPGGAYEHVCEPAFIREVLEEADCGLLLDLGHLQVTADWLGLTSEAMLDQLPLERVVEVHTSSPSVSNDGNGKLSDTHDALTERDLDLLRAVLGRCSPRMVVLEYRKDDEQLRAQLLQLGRVLKRRPRPRPC